MAAAARERREQARLDAQKKKEKDKEDRLVLITTNHITAIFPLLV